MAAKKMFPPRGRLRTCSATTTTKLSLRSAFVFRLGKLLCSFRIMSIGFGWAAPVLESWRRCLSRKLINRIDWPGKGSRTDVRV